MGICSSSHTSPVSAPRGSHKENGLVLGVYRVHTGDDGLMGEGTSSICRKATDVRTGLEVAVKVYKGRGDAAAEAVKLQKFRRQIQVLRQLQEPFAQPASPELWHEQLGRVEPGSLFMRLIDFSKDANGEPAPNSQDGQLYVVTELAQHSLKDYLALRRDEGRPLKKETIKSITRALILVVAGLHAKGLVHLDLKPENLMLFDGRLKLIDVDGCVRANSFVSIDDSSVSFSPCYCAPEWARFLVESLPRIHISPALDVWSVGMTICELVSLDAILKPVYAKFLRNGRREASFHFMDWLSRLKTVPIPESIQATDPELADLILNWLLVCDPAKRKTCAEALSAPYVGVERKRPSKDEAQPETKAVDETVARSVRRRAEDRSSKAPLFQAVLWKLNRGGDPKDATHWLRRDMWVAADGSLCYFSVKESKRLVLVDGEKLAGSSISKFSGGAREFAFEIDLKEADGTYIFAAESTKDYAEWVARLQHHDVGTMRLGHAAEELRTTKLRIKNRRIQVGDTDEEQFAPIFKGLLWKLKAEGDAKNEADWFQREMWISNNYSLVYHSVKESRDLVYYTADNLARARVDELPSDESLHRFSFQVRLPPEGDVEFVPSTFAADSEETMRQWMSELKKLQMP